MDKSRILAAIRSGSVEPFFTALLHKDSPSPPATPDPVATAQAQGTANKDTAIASAQLSNPNVNNWLGSQTVSYQNDPTTGNPIPTVNQTLSPAQQQLYDSQTAMSQQLAGIGQTGLDAISKTLATPITNADGQAATDSAYSAMTSRLDPQWNTAQSQEETQLRGQGLTPGGEAYDNAMRVFNQGKNDAYQQANLGAMQEAPQMQQMDITGRDALLNELNAVRTGSQVSSPQFSPYTGTSVAPTNTLGADQLSQQADLNNYNAQVGSTNSFNGGLMSAAATAAIVI